VQVRVTRFVISAVKEIFLMIEPSLAVFVAVMIAKFVKENKEVLRAGESRKSTYNDKLRASQRLSVDIKGAITLSATTASFIMALTLVQTGGISGNLEEVVAAFLVSIISLSVFAIIERRTNSPLIDFRLLRNRTTVVPYTCSYWDYHVYGISIYSTTGKKPDPTRIWRECSCCRQRAATFHDNVSDTCQCHTIYNKVRSEYNS
jgi:hypothetical protein